MDGTRSGVEIASLPRVELFSPFHSRSSSLPRPGKRSAPINRRGRPSFLPGSNRSFAVTPPVSVSGAGPEAHRTAGFYLLFISDKCRFGGADDACLVFIGKGKNDEYMLGSRKDTGTWHVI